MKALDISVLGYALLGLIELKPGSGYDLRKIFAETAMGNCSSSRARSTLLWSGCNPRS